MNAASGELAGSWRFPGLDALFEMLRESGLPIGPSEAIDATRVVRHYATATPPDDQARKELQFKLRPTLCKTVADQSTFDDVFERWASLGPEIVFHAEQIEAAPEAPAPAPTTNERSSKSRDRWLIALVALSLAGGIAYWQWPRDEPAGITIAPSAERVKPPLEEAPVQPPSSSDAITIYGYFPAQRYNREVVAPWLWAIVLFPLLGLLILAVSGARLPFVARRRGRGTLTLEAWPASKMLEHLVLPLTPAIEGRLRRHVKGPVEERSAYARRPLLDPRRTVEATMAHFGIPTLRYRYARLRPAYLVLVHADRDDDLGVLWASRLRSLDLDVDIFRFGIEHDGSPPRCAEIGGVGRRLAFDNLPNPTPGQRLIVISDPALFFGPDGRLHQWARSARMNRWQQRALFTPDEPRTWDEGQVDALERRRGSDRGMLVFPCDDNALEAWGTLLARECLPEYELVDPQLYPRLLRDDASRFVGDADPSALGGTPEDVGKEVSRVVSQIHAYLGNNGFYWLCACAVPPLLDRRLALLLGEQYFLRYGADLGRTTYMAKNWRRLSRLPWLRDESQIPHWLRLALLTRLPAAVQDKLRDVVRGALAMRSAGGERGAELGFDTPDPEAGDAGDDRHSLYLGFVRDRLTAEQLVLRVGNEWSRWLPQMARQPGLLQSLRRRLSGATFRRGIAGTGPSRLAWLTGIGSILAGVGATVVVVMATRDGGGNFFGVHVLADVPHVVTLESSIESPTFTSDSTRLFTTSFGSHVQVWDVAEGKPVAKLLKLDEKVLWTAFVSPDGGRLLTNPITGPVLLQDAVSGRVIFADPMGSVGARFAQFSPRGTRILIGSYDGTVRIRDAASGELIAGDIKQDSSLGAGAMSYDDSMIVTATDDGTVRVWDVVTGKLVSGPFKGRDALPTPGASNFADRIDSVAFSPDGSKIVIAGARDGTARVIDASSGSPVGETIRHEARVRSAMFSPDGSHVLTGSEDGTARLWDSTTGQQIGESMRDGGNLKSATFSPDGTRIVTASPYRRVRVWDAVNGPPLGEPMRHRGAVPTAEPSPDGTRIVTASQDGTARVWEAGSGHALTSPLPHGDVVEAATFSRDGLYVATASRDRYARVWNAATGKLVSEMPHGGYVWSAVFDRDGRRVVTASDDRTARIWDAMSGQPIGEPMTHEDAVESAVFSPDGTRIVTASRDGSARIWDADGRPVGQPMKHEDWVYSAQFSPDGSRIVTASRDGTARIWDAASGKAVGVPMMHAAWVWSARFSPDGRRIVTASDDHTARLWNAATGMAVGAPMKHDDTVSSAVFSPDGSRVVTASRDRTARVWDAASGAPLSVVLQSRYAVSSVRWMPDGDSIVIGTMGAEKSSPTEAGNTVHGEALRTARLPGNAAYLVHAPPPASVAHLADAFAGFPVLTSDRSLVGLTLAAILLSSVLNARTALRMTRLRAMPR